MRECMRTVLRIAAVTGHRDLCVGSFGVGVPFRNPPKDVAELWRELLFGDKEFRGLFKSIIFIFDTKQRSTGAHGSPNSSADVRDFKEILDPKKWIVKG
jgi:uncharacterized protein (TIGR02452 family)